MATQKLSFGEYFKRLRVMHGVTLRDFCLKNNFDPGNISKLERGQLPPPRSDEKLREYAAALGIAAGSDEWYEFFDRAAADAGTVPADLLSDEKIVSRLPAFFRTLRSKKLTSAALDSLIDKLRNS